MDAEDARRAFGLVDLGRADGARSGACGALLDDLADALAAYERISSAALGEDAGKGPRIVRVAAGAAGGGPVAAAGAAGPGPVATPNPASPDGGAGRAEPHPGGLARDAAGSGDDLAACRAAVLALELHGGQEEAAVGRLTRTVGALPAECGVYAIAICSEHGEAEAVRALRMAGERGAGGTWRGGLALGGGGLLPRLARSPRLGWPRRAYAQATDRLIAALRADLSVEAAARAFGGTEEALAWAREGLVVAPCPVPAWAYRLAIRG